MSTGYSWEGIRQVRVMLLGARHVPERLCGGLSTWGAISSARPLPLPFTFIPGHFALGNKRARHFSQRMNINILLDTVLANPIIKAKSCDHR